MQHMLVQHSSVLSIGCGWKASKRLIRLRSIHRNGWWCTLIVPQCGEQTIPFQHNWFPCYKWIQIVDGFTLSQLSGRVFFGRLQMTHELWVNEKWSAKKKLQICCAFSIGWTSEKKKKNPRPIASEFISLRMHDKCSPLFSAFHFVLQLAFACIHVCNDCAESSNCLMVCRFKTMIYHCCYGIDSSSRGPMFMQRHKKSQIIIFDGPLGTLLFCLFRDCE